MKAEYDLSKMKRRRHPLREKVSRGDITLISLLDIPDREAKLAALEPDEREFILELFARRAANEVSKPFSQAP